MRLALVGDRYDRVKIEKVEQDSEKEKVVYMCRKGKKDEREDRKCGICSHSS